MNGDILHLEKPYHILEEVIKTLTRLCKIDTVPTKKSIQNKQVETLTNVIGDQRALIISMIKDLVTRYITNGIYYKIFFWNKEGVTLQVQFTSHTK